MGLLDIILPTPKPVVLPMEKIYCDKHKTWIVIHKFSEKTLFTDNNKAEVAIFEDEDGSRYLKRYVLNGCNESCPIVQKLLNKEEKRIG